MADTIVNSDDFAGLANGAHINARVLNNELGGSQARKWMDSVFSVQGDGSGNIVVQANESFYLDKDASVGLLDLEGIRCTLTIGSGTKIWFRPRWSPNNQDVNVKIEEGSAPVAQIGFGGGKTIAFTGALSGNIATGSQKIETWCEDDQVGDAGITVHLRIDGVADSVHFTDSDDSWVKLVRIVTSMRLGVIVPNGAPDVTIPHMITVLFDPTDDGVTWDLEWAGDGSDMRDNGGTGGDITTKFDAAGRLGITGSPLHGAFDAYELPESGYYRIVVNFTRNAVSANRLGCIAFASNQKTKRVGEYGSSESNVGAGDQCLSLDFDWAPFQVPRLELNRVDAGVYTAQSSDNVQALTANTGSVEIIVDMRGATPIVSVIVDGAEVMTDTDMGAAGEDVYGRYLLIYDELSGGGSTPSENNRINNIRVEDLDAGGGGGGGNEVVQPVGSSVITELSV